MKKRYEILYTKDLFGDKFWYLFDTKTGRRMGASYYLYSRVVEDANHLNLCEEQDHANS